MALLDYIRAGETGVKGHQARLNVISNNIANVGTVGFKRSFTQFFESYVDNIRAGTDAPGNASTVDGLNRGFGVDPIKAFVDGRDGEYVQTGNGLDLAVQDDGFFIVDRDGQQFYTRDGNLTLDKEKNLLQESTSSFIKGYKATLNDDGTTAIDTTGPLERITFSHLEKLPFHPTNHVDFASNLNADSRDRSMKVVKNHGQLKDANGRILTFDNRWKTLSPESFEYQVRQNGQLAFKAELTTDNLGNILGWKIPDQEGVEVSNDENGSPRHVSYSYNSEKPDGSFERLYTTVTLPAKNITAGGQILMDHFFRKGKPEDLDFTDQEPVKLSSEFNRGTVHKVFSQVVDSKGISHDIGYDFEHIDTSSNRWEYRVNLPEEDPLVQSYLRNPLNGVANPNRPSAVDLEKANDAIFGLSRVGVLQFDEKGIPDLQNSIIPKVQGNSPVIETNKISSTTLNTSEGETVLPLDIYATPEGAGFRYELLLPASSQNIIELSKDSNLNLENPSNPTLNDLRRMNRQLFNGSNEGFLTYDRDGNLDLQKSQISRMRGTLPQGEVNSDVPPDLFQSLRPSLQRSLDENLGTIEMELDMGLVTGFGGEFSTAVREQNGYVDGILKKTSITSTGDGTLVANYTNKEYREIGQLGLAVFQNSQGLIKNGTNLFRLGENTGIDENSIGAPNSFKRGLVHPGILEQSNVNLIDEFTNLIITQRAFQANSKVITTTDSVLQTGIGVKR